MQTFRSTQGTEQSEKQKQNAFTMKKLICDDYIIDASMDKQFMMLIVHIYDISMIQ